MALAASETLALIDLIKVGDEAAKARLVEENKALVWSLVHRFSHHYYDKEDLFQIGCLGLLKAIEKFDPTYEVQFSTYAVPIILGEIKKHFRDDGAIKVSRGLKELNVKINHMKTILNQDLQREPSVKEIADALQVEVEDIVLAMEASYYPTSLSEPVYEKDGSTIDMEDCLSQDSSDQLVNFLTLKDEINKLSDEERELIYLRYYLNWNQDRIAKKFNVSQVQVSRMEKKIILKMRKQFL